jgi:hypothetical protein
VSIITHSPRRPRFARATLGLCAVLATAALPSAFVPSAYADSVALGQSNNETAQTLISNQSSDGAGFLAYGAGSGMGVYGQGGATGNGVQGYTEGATTNASSGVFGWNNGGGAGVFAHSQRGDGVQATGTYGVVGTGTVGGANLSGVDYGLVSISTATNGGFSGVYADGPVGVTANATKGSGVLASGPVGVTAQSTNGPAGNGLVVFGKAVFSSSGKVTIAAGNKSATVTGVALGSTSLVLATAQNLLSTVSVQAAVPVSPTSFTINLTAAVPAGQTVTVGWFIVN